MEKAPEERRFNERQENNKTKFEHYQKDFHLSEEQLQKPLLDVGAGDGSFVKHLREEYGNENAWGVEYSAARANHGEGAVVQASGLEIPFENGVFHTVTAHDYLPMFIHDQALYHQSIAEPLRVIEDGGSFYANTSTPQSEALSIMEYANDPQMMKTAMFSMSRFAGSLQSAAVFSQLTEHGVSLDVENSGEGRPVLHFRKDGKGEQRWDQGMIDEFSIHPERLHALMLPLTSMGELVTEKQGNREPLSISESINAGRDRVIVGNEVKGMSFKPDHAYRMISEETLRSYLEHDSVDGWHDQKDIYNPSEGPANAGVDWYLGGTCPRYGNIVIETPADMRRFLIADSDRNMMAKNPFVRHIKSQGGTELAVPLSDTHAYRLIVDEKGEYHADKIY